MGGKKTEEKNRNKKKIEKSARVESFLSFAPDAAESVRPNMRLSPASFSTSPPPNLSTVACLRLLYNFGTFTYFVQYEPHGPSWVGGWDIETASHHQESFFSMQFCFRII